MGFFNWDEKYSVGILEIDNQHKRLVQMVNDLYDAMRAGKGNDVLGKVLDDLINYTKSHFATEERLMQSKNYADYAPHKAEHEALTKKAIELQQQFKAGKATLTVEVGNFLKDWLTKHILGLDKKYSAALK